VAEKKGEEVAGKSEANRVLAKVEEKAAGNNAGGVSIGKSFRVGENWNDTDLYFDLARFFRAALAPSFPRAVRAFFDKCAIVLFRRAALAAFLMFRFAAARRFLVVIFATGQGSQPKAFAQLALSH
jgi:hypothetical protein